MDARCYDGAGRLSNTRVVKMGANGLVTSYEVAYTGYDQAGNVTPYRMDVYEGSAYSNTYTYAHARYCEATLSGISIALDPGQTTYQYDVNGNLVGVTDSKDSRKNLTLVNDANGKILQRVQDGKTTRSLIVYGELLGTTDPDDAWTTSPQPTIRSMAATQRPALAHTEFRPTARSRRRRCRKRIRTAVVAAATGSGRFLRF